MPKHKVVGGKKSVKIKKVAPKKAKPIYVSDDDVPDESAESFYKDAIDLHHDQLEQDSDDDYMSGTIPEAKAPRKEAVYDFSDSEDEEEMESRLKKIEANIRRSRRHESSDSEEEEEEEDEVAQARAWGKKRDDFYGADVTTKIDVGVSSDDDQAEAILEEKEARMMQQKMAAEITEEDCGLDMFADMTAPDAKSSMTRTADLTLLEAGSKLSEGPEVVQVDFSKMSEKERARTFKQLYPEYMPIYAEFKRMLRELKERLWPILALRMREVIPVSAGLKSLSDKAKLMELFVQCALFYFLLVAEREATKGHPVFERMLSLQKLIKKYDEMETGLFKAQIEHALQMIAEDREDEIMSEGTKSTTGRKVQQQTKAADTVSAAITKKKKKSKKVVNVEDMEGSSNIKPIGSTSTSESLEGGKKTKKKTKEISSEGMLGVAAASGKKAKKDKTNTVKKRMQDLLNEDEESTEELADMTSGEKEALEYYNMMRKRRRAGDEEAERDIGDGEEIEDVNEVTSTAQTSDLTDDKRAITEEMQKNKGLTAKRPKHLKNPRIKNKLKFQKKKKIHKTMVPQVLREMSRYGGEVGGIRAGRVRSVALS